MKPEQNAGYLKAALAGKPKARVSCPACGRGDRDRTFGISASERGAVGHCFRCGSVHIERAADHRSLSRKDIAAAQTAIAAEKAQEHAKGGEAARLIWSKGQPCIEHPYLERKHVRPDGVRVQLAHAAECRGQFFSQGKPLGGLLLIVPLRDMQWRVHSLQAIDAEGNKSFLRGARTSALFHVIGAAKLRAAACGYGGQIAICEGYATGWSIVHQLDDCPVFVAFNAGNLIHVAREVLAKFPKAQIVVCGDNDASGVGQAKAIEAASAIGGHYSIPEFTAEESARGLTDWNDFAQLPRAKADA
jgi:putative DNA primase/helicase